MLATGSSLSAAASGVSSAIASASSVTSNNVSSVQAATLKTEASSGTSNPKTDDSGAPAIYIVVFSTAVIILAAFAVKGRRAFVRK